MNKIFFQGTFGAYSHLAALSIEPKAEIVPCKTFDVIFRCHPFEGKLCILLTHDDTMLALNSEKAFVRDV